MYGVCVRKEELPYSMTDLAFIKSDGTLSNSPSLACHGKKVAFGFGYQFTNIKSSSTFKNVIAENVL